MKIDDSKGTRYVQRSKSRCGHARLPCGPDLCRTDDEVMAREIVDVVVVVDDASRDETVSVAAELPDANVFIFKHNKNKGYGTYRFESI